MSICQGRHLKDGIGWLPLMANSKILFVFLKRTHAAQRLRGKSYG